MSEKSSDGPTINVRLRIKEFVIPPITDALVMGKKAPIGSEAMRRALILLHVAPFDYIEVEDDIVEDILVRRSVLNKVPADKLRSLVLRRVKPFMTIEEVTNVDLQPELTVEEQL